MTKVPICFLFLVMCTLLHIGLTGNTGQYRNWHKRVGQVGSAGKCSALKGILPEPQSGCCGKHAEENNGDEGSNINDSDGEDHIYGGDGTDDNNIDYGNDSNNDAGDSDSDYDFGNDDESMGGDDMDFDKIFNDIKLGGGWNLWHNGFLSKHLAKQNASDIAPDKYITAGKPAGLRQFPWLVHLNIKIREMLKTAIIGCGGSLISPRFVLTAAHCVKVNYRSYDDVSVFLAEYDTRTFPKDCVGRTCIQNVAMHPDKIIAHSGFEPNLLQNDIALMRLRASAPYSEFIRPICLPSFNIDSARNEGVSLIIAGWGSTGRQPSPIKLTAQVQLVPHEACRRHYGDLTTAHVCAAGQRGQDTCQGDSGGPLMVEHEGNYYVVGIVSGKSADTDCGSAMPTLYTNVYKYSQWIKNNMRN